MDDIGLIERQWRIVSKEFPPEMPDILCASLRSAFWSGATAMFSLLSTLEDDTIPEGIAYDTMGRLMRELREEAHRVDRHN